jgi:hypothetical protein
MLRALPVLALLALAGCSFSPPGPDAPSHDPRLLIRILYVLEDGGVFRYDELASAPERRNFSEVRTDRDDTFTRYSFTLLAEGPDRWWTSL